MVKEIFFVREAGRTCFRRRLNPQGATKRSKEDLKISIFTQKLSFTLS